MKRHMTTAVWADLRGCATVAICCATLALQAFSRGVTTGEVRALRPAVVSAQAATLEPVAYAISFPDPHAHQALIEATFPTDGRAAVDLMMPIWSPGFYMIENYATRVLDITARTPGGAPLAIAHPSGNRWRINVPNECAIVVTYRLACEGRSVTTNYVGDDYAVLTGGATFITLAEQVARPHDVRLDLPSGWKQSMTALEPAPDRAANHYRAPDFDTLVDSPIVAGNPVVQTFTVAGSTHNMVEIGDVGSFDGARAARDLEHVVEAHRRLWGDLPFRTYDFLLVFRQGGGGLEHRNSTLATSSAAATATEAGYTRWLNFISHEYCHAFNVKRLRPVELGPFDYENEPHTPSLWIAEGFTSYFGELAVTRAGLTTPEAFVASMSAKIAQLQKSPGRLVQTLEQSSLDVWTSEGISGVNTNAETSVSYYLKGQIAAFLLDAEVRRASNGARSLDDVMRLAYQRYGGARGFTPEQFSATTSEVAGADLSGWFRRTVASAEELDYTRALDWYGLQFAPGGWTLEARADASAAQKARLLALF